MTDTPLLDRSFTRAPLELLRRLHSEAPVSRVVMWGDVPVWLVTGYEEAKALLADPRLSKDQAAAVGLVPSNNLLYNGDITLNMLQVDPPDHTRLRKLVIKAFTPRAAEFMRPRIEAMADGLLATIDTGAPVDLVKAYAGPLPVRVISELLGVPTAYRDHLQGTIESFLNETDRETRAVVEGQLAAMLTELIDEKRRNPAGDLVTALIEAHDDRERLSETELMATLFLLIAAGYDTTVNLIANGVLALLRNPSQLAALRADSGLMPSAIEEFLRFDSPVNITTIRFSTEAIRIGQVDIPKDQFVMVSLLAANRDGARFAGPEQLEITRKPNSHIAFGYGAHYCVGAHLARLEGSIAITRLLARFNRLELATTQPIEYRDSVLMHGLTALPVWCHRS